MIILTYRGSVAEKRATLKQLRQHQALDQIIQGSYWSGNGEGRGCAVGCLTHDKNGGHAQFPDRWGVPTQLAYLIDHIFESLPVEDAKAWPVRIMSAIPTGRDLSGVWDRWCVWMLRRLVASAGVNAPVVEFMASLFERAVAGDEPTATEWQEAAGAAWAAWAAGAAEAARAAWAAWAAGAAGAARAARAAGAAEAAGAAGARHDWAKAAANELCRLVKAA